MSEWIIAMSWTFIIQMKYPRSGMDIVLLEHPKVFANRLYAQQGMDLYRAQGIQKKLITHLSCCSIVPAFQPAGFLLCITETLVAEGEFRLTILWHKCMCPNIGLISASAIRHLGEEVWRLVVPLHPCILWDYVLMHDESLELERRYDKCRIIRSVLQTEHEMRACLWKFWNLNLKYKTLTARASSFKIWHVPIFKTLEPWSNCFIHIPKVCLYGIPMASEMDPDRRRLVCKHFLRAMLERSMSILNCQLMND